MLSLGTITTLMLLPTQQNSLGATAKAGKHEACNFIPSVQSCGTLGKTFTFVKPFSFVEGKYRGLECLGSRCNSTHSLSSMVDLPWKLRKPGLQRPSLYGSCKCQLLLGTVERSRWAEKGYHQEVFLSIISAK